MITNANAGMTAPGPRLGMWVVVLLLVLAAAAPPVLAAPPAQGMFLIANREMQGSWFAQSVILLIQHDEFGTVGLIVNRPTGMNPAELLPEIAGLSQLQDTLYIGGPVASHGVRMLVRSQQQPDDSVHVFADVYASGSQDLLRAIAQEGDPGEQIRLYAGHAGWAPGQLDDEIRRGSWTVKPAAETHVFSNRPADIWERLAPSAKPIIVQRPDHITQL